MIDLLTNPENRGIAEIEAAPIKQKAAVQGIVLYKPPRSEPKVLPVRYNTAPMDMKRRDLYKMWAKMWAQAPLIDMAVPIPIPTTIYPNWLIME